MKTVKVISKSRTKTSALGRQLPGSANQWGDCRFTFDPDERRYDWLVVYDEMNSDEKLACHKNNTILITSEPSSIKIYGKNYVSQFGHVLTSHEKWAISHPGKIYSQPALKWYYGEGQNRGITYDQMVDNPPLNKTKLISTVCSSKQQWHTLHKTRYDFTQKLKKIIPELDVFGRGVKLMDDKAEALDLYKYHVAVENYIAPHYWTEKLSDSFLGCTLPFYYGAPNIAEYFSEESYIPIDIFSPGAAAEIIRKAIADNEYDKRLPYILEARKLVLEKYNLFAVVDKIVQNSKKQCEENTNSVIFSRHNMRRKHIISDGILTYFKKIQVRISNTKKHFRMNIQ